MKKILAMMLTVVLCIGILPQHAFSTERISAKGSMDETVTFEFDKIDNYLEVSCGVNKNLYYYGINLTGEDINLKISTLDTDVIEMLSGDSGVIGSDWTTYSGYLKFRTLSAGIANIVVSVGHNTYTLKVYVAPDKIDITNISQTGYKDITLEWEKTPGCSGYIIKKRYINTADWENVAVLYGEERTSATVSTELYKVYGYQVVGFVEDSENRLSGKDESQGTRFVAEKIKAELVSVQPSGSKSLTVKWKKMEEATGYNLYRSTEENGNYRCIYKADANTTSYEQEVNQGITYYYKVTAICQEGESDYSKSIGQFIPKTGTKRRVVTSVPGSTDIENAYYYQTGGKLYMVCVTAKGKLDIYEVTSSLKVGKCIKSLKLRYDHWGSFFAGTDGKFYVVVGYDNLK